MFTVRHLLLRQHDSSYQSMCYLIICTQLFLCRKLTTSLLNGDQYITWTKPYIHVELPSICDTPIIIITTNIIITTITSIPNISTIIITIIIITIYVFSWTMNLLRFKLCDDWLSILQCMYTSVQCILNGSCVLLWVQGWNSRQLHLHSMCVLVAVIASEWYNIIRWWASL